MPKSAKNNDPSALIKLAIDGIDAQIKDLLEKREQLAKLVAAGDAPAAANGRRRGRPPGSKNKGAAVSAAGQKAKKRVVSAATRKKLKEAAKARWERARSQKNAA